MRSIRDIAVATAYLWQLWFLMKFNHAFGRESSDFVS